uniref:Uncharacterized protein LOC114339720 n=1 Tax=Diabrotica virgifera virgifera TaxID=50390 RepID=A0A6P7GLU7_DIAVI
MKEVLIDWRIFGADSLVVTEVELEVLFVRLVEMVVSENCGDVSILLEFSAVVSNERSVDRLEDIASEVCENVFSISNKRVSTLTYPIPFCRQVGVHLEQSCTSPINVTTNPLDPVHFGGSGSTRKTPQATIVVQQPSVSLDHTNVSTILLKNGSEFVSNVQDSAKGKLKREENMKQLLDVAHNLTLEEMHDFEMKYGSPHHNRSQSVKTPGRSSGRPNYLCLPQQRSRVASMPNTGVEEEYYRLRHFSITGKGVVNRGDSLKSRRSRSNNSVASSNS